jgi:hypothetical protein
LTWHGEEGLLKRIHVNQHVIRSNRKLGAAEPPIRVKTYRENVPCSSVRIDGPSELIYRPDDPLSCGARLWVETRAPVTAD